MKVKRDVRKRKIKNIHLTLIFLLVLGFIVVGLVYFIQTTGQDSVEKCSYLDPLAIDILAFLAAIYLIIEGLVKIFVHREEKVNYQLSRILRVIIGFSVLTIHLLQTYHKVAGMIGF